MLIEQRAGQKERLMDATAEPSEPVDPALQEARKTGTAVAEPDTLKIAWLRLMLIRLHLGKPCRPERTEAIGTEDRKATSRAVARPRLWRVFMLAVRTGHNCGSTIATAVVVSSLSRVHSSWCAIKLLLTKRP